MNKINQTPGTDYVAQYSENGQRIINECRKKLQDLNIPVWETYHSKEKTDGAKTDESKTNIPVTSISEYNKKRNKQKTFTNFTNPANKAYTNFVKSEHTFIKSSNSTDSEINDSNSTILSSGRIVETMETIDDAGKKHLSFLTETAPESGCISGSINGYYEGGSNGNNTVFLGSVENAWQNKNKNIYTKINATIGVDKQPQDDQNKIVGNISFDGRLDKNKFIYGAGVEYNSYSNNTKILDIHVAGKHKKTGIGADLTRRTTFSIDDTTGERVSVSNMKLKLDIISNKTEDQDNTSSQSNQNNQQSENSNFSFETDSSALPSEVEEVDNNARQLISEYIKPNRKNGSDLDFEYTENRCGVTYEYNYNFIDKKDSFLSVTPVIGLHEHTDQTLKDNNESLAMTGGITTQFGKKTANGQTFTGSVTAIADRIVKRGSHPYDSKYMLASFQYNNSKAKLNAELDTGALKSGNICLKYVNINAEKEMKNSSIGVSAGFSNYKINDESSNLYNVMATYKYNFQYKTKR